MTATDAAEEFRRDLRAWLVEHLPHDWRDRAGLTREDSIAFDRWWLSELHAGGYAPPTWPKSFGGAGLTIDEEIVLYEELARADAPWPHAFYCALNQAGLTIIEAGDEHQHELLPPILRGEQIWCQAFSEPGAGSDLASLRTTAVRDGDTYILNGQKTWSSLAPWADWAILLARTDPSAPKRKGISYFLVDLHLPGIEIRPIRQLTGDAEFGEIFLTDVRVPVADRIGAENDGWRVANVTLSAERGPGHLRFVILLKAAMRTLLELAQELGLTRDQVPSGLGDVREALARVYTKVDVLEAVSARVLENLRHTGGTGPEASVLKLFSSTIHFELTELAVRLEGLEGQLDVDAKRGSGRPRSWYLEHLLSWMYFIGAGTSEIQRNLIGERVLGLPRDPLTE